MCGIVGYLGKKDGAKVVIDGLKKLEYRGYDSWGIALRQVQQVHCKQAQGKPSFSSKGKILVHKQVGKIGGFDLEKELPNFAKASLGKPDFACNISIGHTRWATHGGVTKENSHPHFSSDGRIAVAHNGIVENYQELKEDLLKKGIKFKSETDTEVIPHLIELELKKKDDLELAVKKTLKKLEGSFGVVVLDRDNDILIGARKGSPLVLGIGNPPAGGEYFFASDVPAFLKFTNKVIFLDDYQMAVVTQSIKDDEQSANINNGQRTSQQLTTKNLNYKIIDLKKDEQIEVKPITITWSAEAAEKGGHPHFMIKEMLEQPIVVDKTIATSSKELAGAVSMIQKAKNIYIVACGTALHAAMYGSYLLAYNNKINARPVSAGEFPYFSELIKKGDLVIAVSQSGETADLLESVKSAKEHGAKVLALVNVMGSTLMRIADEAIITKAGPEICVLSTKAYISQLGMFVMISKALEGKPEEGKKILKKVKADIENIISESSRRNVKKAAKKLSNADNIYAIGRGFNYATSLEACLKIKEVSYIHAEGFAGGDLKHGPISLIEQDVPVLVFVADDGADKEIISNAMEVKSRGARVIGIGFSDNQVFETYLPVAKNDIYTPLSSIVYSQLMAYYIALEKNLDPDKPRNLAKSVTVK